MTTGLPEGWATMRVGDYFHSWGGMTPSTSNATYWGGNVPWVSSKDIKAWRIAGGEEFITRKALQETRIRLCPVGSVLVVVRSGILAHTLPIAVADSPVSINQDLKAFYSPDSNLNEWLALALRALAPEILTNNRKDGTTVQSVRYEELCDLIIPVPPSTEQRRITKRLGELLQKIRDTRERLSRIPAILKRFRQVVLAAACSGRLTEDLGLPDSWTETSLGALAVEIRTGPFGSALHRSDYVRGGIPVINPTNIIDGKIVPNEHVSISEETFRHLEEYALRSGDIIIARRGEMGRCAVVDSSGEGWLCGTGSAKLRLKKTAVPHFVQMFISSSEGRAYLSEGSVGSTMENLNQKLFARMPLSLPSIEEQQEIVRRVKRLFELANAIEMRTLAAHSQVDKLIQSILAKAFRGELVPTEAELARREGREHEPAPVLLERIKKERESQTSSKPERKRTRPRATLVSAKG